MEKELIQIREAAISAIKKASDAKMLQDLYIKYLGRKGLFNEIIGKLKDLPPAEKPKIGQLINEVKSALTKEFEKRQQEFENEGLEKALKEEWIDITAPGAKYDIGHIHPVNQVGYKVEHIFQQMGFTIMDGPEVESEYCNFEGLNIPKDHPARDMQDTFFVEQKPDEKHGRLVLRTHTSPTGQVRALEQLGAPLRVIAPGRCFRYEATDASHDSTFDQVEGMLIDKNISLAHLKGIMREFLTRLFRKEVKVRFRPGYFPFVEPGLELDFSCLLCGQKGCRVCKHTGWVEFMGCGMTHPNVLKMAGIDPNIYQGWAFGFGLTRLTMMKHEIDDIRLLTNGDLRFLNQF